MSMSAKMHALKLWSYIRVAVERHQEITPPYYGLEFTDSDHALDEECVFSKMTDIAGREYEIRIRPITVPRTQVYNREPTQEKTQ